MIDFLGSAIEGVAFDLDGTLIDSMQQHANCWEKALNAQGFEFNRALYIRCEGVPLRTLIPLVSNIDPADESYLAQLIEAKDREYLRLGSNMPFVKGALDLLSFFKEHKIPTGLVTAGQRARVYRSLDDEQLSSFQKIVCGDECSVGKPFPHPYLKASELLGVDTSKLLVIENSVCGAVSSYLANAKLVMVGEEDVRLPNVLGRFDGLHHLMKKVTS